MMSGTALRAVVFELEDLPAGDRRHILDVASCLRLPLDDCFHTPLVLTRDGTPPPAPGLKDDTALAEGGPSLLLLAMRLVLADAYHWPEQRWLTPQTSDPGETSATAGYTLYAANPKLWNSETLSTALAARGAVQRGLQQRHGRPPVAAGDRVPLLGFAVPVIGGKGPVRDLRPADQRPYRFGGVAVPLGMTPAGATGRHGLFFRVHGARLHDEQVDADLEIALVDGALGQSRTLQLSLTLTEPGAPAETEADDDLGEWLREVLPGCLLVNQQGEPLLLDLHRLGMRSSSAALRVLQVAPAPPDADDGPEVLDPMMWEPAVLAGLLQESETQISGDGRLVSLRFTGLRDGLPVDTYVVLAGGSPQGPLRPVAWSAELGGASPSLALGGGGALALAPGRIGSGPEASLCLGCLAEGDAEAVAARTADLLLVQVRTDGAAPRALLLVGAVALPEALAAPTPPALYFIDGSQALLCHQATQGLFCTVDLATPGAQVRPTTAADLLSALQGGGEALVRRFLRSLAAADPTDDEVPALGFLGAVSDFAGAAEGPLDVAALLQAPAPEAAAALLRRFLGPGRQRTWTEAGPRAIE